jgi:hypothetical protein
MRKDNPDASERTLACCLYWQGHVRKILRPAVKKVMKEEGYDLMTEVPEAMGVNVLRTLNLLGIPIKRIPRPYVYKVAMLGYKKV